MHPLSGNGWIPIASGELPALEHLLSGYYHQNDWEDASTDEEIWRFFSSHESYARDQLLREVDVLMAHDPRAIRAFLNQHSDALGVSSTEESMAWVQRLKSWLSGEHVV